MTASLRSDEHQARQALFNNHEHFEASMTHCRVHGCTSAAATTPLNVLLVAVLLSRDTHCSNACRKHYRVPRVAVTENGSKRR